MNLLPFDKEFEMLVKKKTLKIVALQCVVIRCKLNFVKIVKCLLTLFSEVTHIRTLEHIRTYRLI